MRKRREIGPCSVADCLRPAIINTDAGILCNTHYMRKWRHGNPSAGRTEQGSLMAFIKKAAAHHSDECLLWPFGVNRFGYGMLHYKGRKQNASRVVCELAHGPAPTPMHQAAHDAGGRPCVSTACINPHHLRWATPRENAHDRIAHGTHKIGIACNSAKLSECEVLEILALKGAATRAAIADQFGVSAGAVGDIHTGKTWAWLTSAGGQVNG
jgi:hypothetical protein